MDSVVRGLAVYFILLFVFRVINRRALAQITTFDLALLLIISETTQQALLGNDFSVTNAFLLILTLVAVDIGLSIGKQRWRSLDKALEGTPLLIVNQGTLLHERMEKEHLDDADILEAARTLQGLERLDQVKYAVLERNGQITIIPKQE